uniref:DNA-directed RNA polymerase subunit alpha n=1 Tax=Helicosporidium sp. subsp. Simulium jonesii TaxID=145475 RepID=RPOA_HELSJ|nr:PEP RNA polymerase alpha subunit [Helicosporidium sp. ex Simulium jonesi]Q2EEW7.1 RecName: Full=DNA-directed RNA polymerase subunit alpha; Short=PEP; AltName: Full=Plastid-encoded RNA polymerase subunit alpha; Short=RNA polymerase subunit alpha [Helicosporidium sp. ex Simulium jonesi]ABD33975.1 RNA polymerase alpha chain [Helicosporidium sp. ex Simulium jonesi]
MLIKQLSSSYNEYNNNYAASFLIGPLPEGIAQSLGFNIRSVLLKEFPYFAVKNIRFNPENNNYKTHIGTKESIETIINTILGIDFNYSFDFYKAMGLYKSKPKALFQENLSKAKFLCSAKQVGEGILYAKDLMLPVGIKCTTPYKIIAHVTKQNFLGFTFELGFLFGLNNNIKFENKLYSIKTYPIQNINIEIINSKKSFNLNSESIILSFTTKSSLQPIDVIKILSYLLLNKHLILIKAFQQFLD